MPEENDTQTSSNPASSRLIRLKEVQHRVGLGRSTIYKRMSEGRFPQARSLGPKCVVWVEAEIDDWISRILESDGLASR